MVTTGGDQGGPSRRDFLKAGGAGALTIGLAGCDELPDEGDGESGTDERGTTETGDGGGGGDGGDEDPYVAGVAAIDREVAADADDLARATFSEEYYERVESAATGADAPEEATPVGHAVKYGHRTPVAGEDVPDVPTLNRLSLGAFTVPAPEGGQGAGVFASAPLSEIVALGDGPNPFLAAAGLGGTVDWLEGPVSMDRRGVEFLDGEGVAETFVGVIAAEPGPVFPSDDGDGFLDGEGVQTPMFVAVQTARTTVGDTVAMLGMVEGFRRPPTMGPGETGIGEDLGELLAEVYDQVVRAELFDRSIDGSTVEVVSAIPGRDERPPPPETESKKPDVGTTVGLGADDQVELGYPTENVFTDRASTKFVVGRDVPGLFSDEEFDEDEHSRGTKYFLKPQYRAAVYPVDGDDSIAFGAVVSPRCEVEGQERNPLATERFSQFLPSYQDLDPLVASMGDFRSFRWLVPPSTFATLSGPDLLGRSAELKGLRGTLDGQPGGVGPEDAVTYVARTRTSTQVVLSVALSFETGDGFFGGADAAERLFREGVERTRFRPTTPSAWVDGSVDDLNLVQICRDTRLETASGDVLTQPDPDLVEGRFTAAPFDVSTFDGTAQSGSQLQYGVFRFEAANRSDAVGETVLSRSGLDDLDTDSTDPDVLFDGNRQDGNADNDLPVFELQGSDDSVSLEFRAPSGYTYDTTTVREGSDYSTTNLEFLRVGFITVSDPGDGDNYGDGDGGPTDYEETVESAVEYFKRTYPTGIAAYRHDAAIEGVKNVFGNATNNTTKDYRNARVALERVAKPGNNNWSYSGTTMAHKTTEGDARSQIRSNGFDVWVLIVPDGYYQFHRDDRPTGWAPGPNHLAVMAVEGTRYSSDGRPDAAETAAQEIAHRLGNDQYQNPTSGNGESNPLAQRDDPNPDDPGRRDLDHARHLSSDLDGRTGTDGPGVVSRAYSLAEGEFVVPTGHEWDGGYQVEDVTNNPTANGSYGPTGSAQRLGRMEGYMSYSSNRQVWTDSVITQDVIDSGLNRDPGNFRTRQVLFGGLNEVSADRGAGDSAESPSPSVSDLQVDEATTSEIDDGSSAAADAVVEVALYDPNGEQVAATTVAAQTGADGDEVEGHTLAGDATFVLEFPPAAVEMTVDAETGTHTANPITRVIREAYDRVPPEAFPGDPAPVRDRVDELLASVDAAMLEGAFGTARDELAAFAEAELADTVDPAFEPAPNEYDEPRLRALFEEMLGRLDALADDGSGTTGEIRLDERPGWTDWVPEPSALPTFADQRAVWQYDVASVLEAGNVEAKAALDEPMANPFVGGYLGVLRWEDLGSLDLGEEVLGPAAVDTSADPAEVPAETGLLLGDVQAYFGAFDTERLDAAVEEGPVEETDVPGVYAHTEAEFAFAYDATYVVGAPTPEEVGLVLETADGERRRWHETESEVQWLYRAGTTGDVTLVAHRAEGTLSTTGGELLDVSPFTDASGLAQSATTAGETFTDATAGVVYPSEDAVELDLLRETLAVEAQDREVTREGRFVQVRATFGE